MARDLTNLLFVDEQLIRFEPERQRSTHAKDGNVFVSMLGCSRNGTWQVTNDLTKLPLEPELVARSRRGKWLSIRLYERKTIGYITFRFV